MPDAGHDKRRASRVEVVGHALVLAPGIKAHCIVRDISSTGAKIGISNVVKLPAAFDLWLMKTRTKRRVFLRWRRGDFAGVEFCQRMAATENPRPAQEDDEIWVV